MKVNVPAASDAITLGQYVDYLNAVDDTERAIVATGEPREKVLRMNLNTIRTIIETFERAVNIGTMQDHHIIGDLGFIPDFTAMSLAEYIDLEQLSKELKTDDGKIDGENLIKFMSVLYRPIKTRFLKQYWLQPYDCDEAMYYRDKILALPMAAVNSTMVFFWTLENELQQSSLDYMKTQAMEAMKAS